MATLVSTFSTQPLFQRIDSAIWEYAKANSFVIISKDEDFVDRWLVIDEAVSLIWIRKGNCSTAELIAWFEPFWNEIVQRLIAGERLIELRF